MKQALMNMTSERRVSRRLEIHLPIEVSPTQSSSGMANPIHAVTRNVSPGGVYFEAPAANLVAGHEINVQLTVPPGEGYFPYAGRVKGTAEIIRVDALPNHTTGPMRAGVAARFRDTLKLVF